MTQIAKVLQLLRRKEGATNVELNQHVGWRFAARVSELRKKYGLEIKYKSTPTEKQPYLTKYTITVDDPDLIIVDWKLQYKKDETYPSFEQAVLEDVMSFQEFQKTSLKDWFKKWF